MSPSNGVNLMSKDGGCIGVAKKSEEGNSIGHPSSTKRFGGGVYPHSPRIHASVSYCETEFKITFLAFYHPQQTHQIH